MSARAPSDRESRVPRRIGPRDRLRGVTLVELAIAIAIVGLLLGGLLSPLATQLELRRHRATEAQLREVKDALTGFALANHNRLPCPDVDGDGLEDRAGSTPVFCADVDGYVPWATLGVDRLDAWGRRMRYVADGVYAGAKGVPNPPDTTCCLAVQDRDGVTLVGDSVAPGDNGPAAVVYSCGSNGVPDEGNDHDGIVNATADCTNPGRFDGLYVQGAVAGSDFDDVLTWLSKNVLVSQLVAGEAWPP